MQVQDFSTQEILEGLDCINQTLTLQGLLGLLVVVIPHPYEHLKI